MKLLLFSILLHFTLAGTAQPFIYHVNAIANSVAIFDDFGVGTFTVVLENLESPQDVAINHGSNTVYISDPGLQKIIGINNDGVFDLVDDTRANDLEIYDDNSKMLWTSVDDIILSYDFDSGVIDTLVQANQVNFYGLAVAQDGSVFVSDRINDKILKYNLDGSEGLIIVENTGDIWDIEVDEMDNMIYFSDRSEELIVRADYNGSVLDTILADLGDVRGLDIDQSERKLYWATDKFGSKPDKLQRADMDGSNLETLIELSPFSNFAPYGVELGNSVITNMDEVSTVESLNIYPNPFGEFIIINIDSEMQLNEPARLRLLSQDGKIVSREAVHVLPHVLTTSSIPVGAYYVEVEIQGKVTKSTQVLKVK